MNKKTKPPPPWRWDVWARPNQKLPLGPWVTWLIMAGRGFGKTRTGAETVRTWVETKKCRRIALVADTEQDARRTMLEGPSGLLSIGHPKHRPRYTITKGELMWPCGAKAMIYTAECPEKLRGAQFDGAWVDELAKFRHPQAVWDQLMFGLRLGEHPQVVVTTTPRPLSLLQDLVQAKTTKMTQGTTYDNKANLSPTFLDHILKRYEGTRLGAQEIDAQLMLEQPGALWQQNMIQYGMPKAVAKTEDP